ncbi:MAG TPA: hypothetical protein VMQ54_15725, partial [Steroidobacteraceae bacterium]|nr:hypothetical protein [Steroidobacteraceae bacterium]
MIKMGAAACPIMILLLVALGGPGLAQPATDVVKPGDNLVIENIPPIPLKVAEDTAKYGESRPSTLFGWHPTRREILIGTRFGDTVQVHGVAMPGGARRQLTFFPDRVLGAQYLPDGKAFIFQKDTGGGEWYQIYRDDLATGDTTLLTDGHSRNNNFLLAHHDTKLVYTSTQRNNKDDDLWILDAAPAGADHASPAARLLTQVDGGGWTPVAWSQDNRRLLVIQFISVNESYLWLVDAASGEKTPLKVRTASAKPGEKTNFSAGVFSNDGKSIYVLTDSDNEFQRLARIDLKTLRPTYLSATIAWDLDAMTASEDGKLIALAANENGYSKLYVFDTAAGALRPLPEMPPGVIGNLWFHPSNHELGFTVTSSRIPDDVYSVDIDSGKLERWTEGETGGLNSANFVEPKLIKWKSFDGLALSGLLYQPDPVKFPGKRPVIVAPP